MECDASTSRRFSRLLVLTRCIYFFCLGFWFVMYVRSMHPRVLWRDVDIPARLYLHLEFRVYIYFFFGVWTVTVFFPLSKHMVHPGGYPSWGWLIGLSLDRDKVLYKLFYLIRGWLDKGSLSVISRCHRSFTPYTIHKRNTDCQRLSHSDWYPKLWIPFLLPVPLKLLALLGLFSIDVDRKWRTNPGRLLADHHVRVLRSGENFFRTRSLGKRDS